MSWRDLMQAKPRQISNSPDLRDTSTKSTKPCGQIQESANSSNSVDFVDPTLRSENVKPPHSPKPGMTIRYRIPVIQSPTDYEWEWHEGSIELVDEDWQMVLVIPETEGQPWRWVARCYIQKEIP